jgi:hypothetical protein
MLLLEESHMTYNSQKFGIQSAGTTGIIQPKLKYKFKVEFVFPDMESRVLTRDVISVDRPTLAFAEGTVHSYNSIAYYAQKPEWAAINMSLRDGIDNASSKIVQAQMQRQMNHMNQESAQAGNDYKFTTKIMMLDGGQAGQTGETAFETWTLSGCFFTSFNFTQLDYSSSDAVQIDLAMRYDYAEQEFMDISNISMLE